MTGIQKQGPHGNLIIIIRIRKSDIIDIQTNA
jgi:hypothetical protein